MARLNTKDLVYVARARRAGARYAWRIIKAAKETGLKYSWALAVVEQESEFENIFGHDPGGAFKGERVTRSKVTALVRAGAWNGIGLTQLTWSGFVFSAQASGGAHRPYVQCKIGFQALANLQHQYGEWDGARRYNGSGPAATDYGNRLVKRRLKWLKVLRGEKA